MSGPQILAWTENVTSTGPVLLKPWMGITPQEGYRQGFGEVFHLDPTTSSPG